MIRYLEKVAADRKQRLRRMQVPQGSRAADPLSAAASALPDRPAVAKDEITALASRIGELERQLVAVGGRRPLKAAAPQIRIADVKAAVASRYGIATTDLEGPCVRGPLGRARQVAIYLARYLTGSKFITIARQFRLAGHAGPRKAFCRIDRIRLLDSDLDRDLEALTQQICALTATSPFTQNSPKDPEAENRRSSAVGPRGIDND
jgi:hypothetical protein